MKISAVLIVKNEEAMLARCLESVKEADEIIICDTGSTDGTLEIAKKYTDKIYTDCPPEVWREEDGKKLFHFANARNWAKAKATGDWILSIDADEFLHDYSEVKKAVAQADQCVAVQMKSEIGKANFFCPRIFRNSPHIAWYGAAHNHIGLTPSGVEAGVGSVSGEGELIGNVTITYGYSPTHVANPDRTLDILKKEVKDPTKSRERYYLAREYWYKQDYKNAARYCGEHVLISNFPAERADSFLMMARCYSSMGLDDDARDACLQAININPHFKEAVKFMGHISLDANAAQWYKWAETCDNRDVLFVREE